MDTLWAPWRIDYILSPKESGCFFCRFLAENDDPKRLILHRGKKTFVIMNYYPYNNGHLLVAPYAHVADLSAIDNQTHLELMQIIDRSTRILQDCLKADGFNIGLNLGSVAGAGVRDHLHFHIVPRWNGDTNFMPILGHTKVVSEGLQETYLKLKKYFSLTGN